MHISHTDIKLLFKNLILGPGCWGWRGAHTKGLYPTMKLGGRAGSNTTVSRVICTIWHGPAPHARSRVCHSCDNQLCLNPLHMAWGDQSINIKQAYDRGRRLSPMAYKALKDSQWQILKKES